MSAEASTPNCFLRTCRKRRVSIKDAGLSPVSVLGRLRDSNCSQHLHCIRVWWHLCKYPMGKEHLSGSTVPVSNTPRNLLHMNYYTLRLSTTVLVQNVKKQLTEDILTYPRRTEGSQKNNTFLKVLDKMVYKAPPMNSPVWVQGPLWSSTCHLVLWGSCLPSSQVVNPTQGWGTSHHIPSSVVSVWPSLPLHLTLDNEWTHLFCGTIHPSLQVHRLNGPICWWGLLTLWLGAEPEHS